MGTFIKIFGFDKRWILRLGVIICFFILTGCQNKNSDVEVSENIELAQTSSSAFDEGHHVLFNAKTRFEYPRAIELLEQAVSEDASNTQAKLYLIYAYNKRGRYKDALEYIPAIRDNSSDLSPKELLWFEALTARAEDDIEREIRFWSETTNQFPEDRWAWYELASAYQGLENYAESAKAAARAIAIEPSSEKWEASWVYYIYSKALYRSGQYTEAANVKVSAESSPTTWRSSYFRLKLGEVASSQNKDTDNIVEKYRAISNKEGRNNTSYTEANIALFFFELGDFANAVKHAQTAYDLEPKAYQSWALGFSLIENGRAIEALEIMEKAVETYPENNFSLAAKGWALYRLGRFEEARNSLVAAKEASSRKNFQINSLLKTIEGAIANPDQPIVPAIPWLG